MNKMPFRVRDTSSQYQPSYVDPVPAEPTEEKTSKKSKNKVKKSAVAPKPVVNQSGGGFQMKHDPTNQCDYF